MSGCIVNGRKIMLVADVPTLPQEKDPMAPSPVMKFVPPEQKCERYKGFLEAVDAFIRKELLRFGLSDVGLFRAEQHIPGQTWTFYYEGLEEGDIPVSLSGVGELEVPEGAVLSMDDLKNVEIRPK